MKEYHRGQSLFFHLLISSCIDITFINSFNLILFSIFPSSYTLNILLYSSFYLSIIYFIPSIIYWSLSFNCYITLSNSFYIPSIILHWSISYFIIYCWSILYSLSIISLIYYHIPLIVFIPLIIFPILSFHSSINTLDWLIILSTGVLIYSSLWWLYTYDSYVYCL